jgi:FkbM family methyltransferase
MEPPAHLITQSQLPLGEPARVRIALAAGCRDCDGIPKVAGAGEVVEREPWPVQRMHNGVLIARDSYVGPWMTQLIQELRGHHEPQEERVFHEVLGSLQGASTMVELGAWWGFYSLWFRQRFPEARSVLVEPDPHLLEIGRYHFALNGREGEFIQAAVDRTSGGDAPFLCVSDGVERPVARVSVDSLVESLGIGKIDLLLADIQGAELAMLEGMERTLAGGKMGYLFLSTHDWEISGDHLTHERCLAWIEERRGHVVAEHTVEESFSGDGLIVAAFGPERLTVPISRNRARHSLFGLPAARLDRLAAELKHLKSLEADPAVEADRDWLRWENKQLKKRLDRGAEALGRHLRQDGKPGDPWTSRLFQVRRLRRLRERLRMEDVAAGRLRELRAAEKTSVVLGHYGIFEVLNDEQIISPIFIHFHQWEFSTLRRAVKLVAAETGRSLRSATLLDIGANIGMMGIQLLSAGLMKRCIAIEPEPTNFALLHSNVRLNGMDASFELGHFALGAREGVCQMEVSESNCGDHRIRTDPGQGVQPERFGESGRKTIKIPMRRLDEYLDRAPGDFVRSIGLCWIDVQGFESEVIRGGHRHLAKHGWPSVLEFWPYGMLRAGMDGDRMTELAGAYWTKFIVLTEGHGEPGWRPIAQIRELWKTLSGSDKHVDILVMRGPLSETLG